MFWSRLAVVVGGNALAVSQPLVDDNSQLIAAKHYLQVTDSHFQEATQIPTQKGTEMAEPDGKTVIRPLRENEKSPEFPGLSVSCRLLHKKPVPPTGVEPVS